MGDRMKPSRREFLKGTTAAAAGIALVGGLDIARTAYAAGSDELKIALIGCGARGTGAVIDCLTSCENIRLVALGDAFKEPPSGLWSGCGKTEAMIETKRRHEDRRSRRPHFHRARRLPEGDRRRSRHGLFRHPARLPARALCGGRRGGQARLLGETDLRQRPRLPPGDGNEQSGRRKGTAKWPWGSSAATANSFSAR